MLDNMQALAELVESSQKVTHTVGGAQCFIVCGKVVAYIPPMVVLVRAEQQAETAAERQYVVTVGMSTTAKERGRDIRAAQPVDSAQVPFNLGVTMHSSTGSRGHAMANVIRHDSLRCPT